MWKSEQNSLSSGSEEGSNEGALTGTEITFQQMCESSEMRHPEQADLQGQGGEQTLPGAGGQENRRLLFNGHRNFSLGRWEFQSWYSVNDSTIL